ncbi:hypothetical protein HP507_03950, partial [Curtobacterium pusillum]|nr:hypothetical protein [Curtobacterium pusillum]
PAPAATPGGSRQRDATAQRDSSVQSEAPAQPDDALQDAPARREAPAGPDTSAQQPSTAPAGPATPEPAGAPVTQWAVAAIPSTDPTAGAASEHAEPSWSAPFGTTDTGEPVAPVQTVSDPTADAALAAQLRPASSLGAGAPQAAPTTGAVPLGSDVPVDDYPLDDDPYGDGEPYPDAAAPSQPVAQPRAAPSPAPASAPQQRQAAPIPQVRRTPVAGRYGEAVVREILNAQFIEETSLHEEGA